MYVQPNTFFFSVSLVNTISRSHQPPYHRALFDMNSQSIPLLLRLWRISGAMRIACIFCDAALYVECLVISCMSDTIISGSDLLLQNRLRACRNVPLERSGTTSKCTSLVDAHFGKDIHIP